MSSFRFIHTADIHLDSPLRGLAGHAGSVTDRIRTASRVAFEELIGIAIEEAVNFVIIAGDLYDGDWPDFNTGLFFVQQMGRLNEAGIEVYLLFGNHDAESQITRSLTLPSNVKAFDHKKPKTYTDDSLGVSLHGQSYPQRDVTDNLVATYPEPTRGKLNIGVLHTGLGGMGGHANYAPCSITDLVNKGYDYWALGHVHSGKILHHDPYIVFPGNLQGRHTRETGEKGAYLINVEDGEVREPERISSDVVRWAVVPVIVSGCANLSQVFQLVGDAIENAVSTDALGRLLACRIQLQGESDLHGQLLAIGDRLVAEARAAALSLGDEVAWVEKVIVDTKPKKRTSEFAQGKEVFDDVLRVIDQARNDESLVQDLSNDISQMVSGLPPELRSETADQLLELAITGEYAALIEGVLPYLSAKLTSDDGS